MKRSIILALCLLLAAFALPLAAFASRPDSEPDGGPSLQTSLPEQTTAQTSAQTTAPAGSGAATTASSPEPAQPDRPDSAAYITVLLDGAETQMTIEEAAEAIVAAEMPALFPEEALKAQAVAARTYIAYRLAHPVSAHAGAVICDNPAHCCALSDLDALAASWGENGRSYADRITKAVADTAGQILTYEGEPIMAVFHSMSGAKTNDCADVWGGDVPYLVSVAAPEGEAGLAGYTDTAVFDSDEFREMFLARYPSASLDPDALDWFSGFERAGSGLVKSVSVGGVSVSGNELRSLCGLRSASFTVTQGTGRIQFVTEGYGHGVGMSQNGAKVLALKGYSYSAILTHYYTGAALSQGGTASQTPAS